MKINDSILEINNLSIGYCKTEPLASHINLSVKKGEVIGLIGLNGAGKSTFFKTILDLQKPLSGEIRLFGKSVSGINRNKMARLCSFVSTENVRVSEMDIYSLVSAGRFPYTGWNGILGKKDKEVVEESISLVGLEKLQFKKISNISDGERQRALIARALAQDTPFIIMDEPTAFLDILNRNEIINLLSRLSHEKEKSILFSTHDLTNALQVADKIWLLHNNKIEEDGPEDMLIKGSFNEVFAGKGIVFNPETLSFKRINKKRGTIHIKGEGIEKSFTQSAIERIGFEFSENETELFIEITSNSEGIIWNLYEKNLKTEFNSIYNLVSHLKRINL